MNKTNDKSMPSNASAVLVTVGACLLFPVLLPVALVLAAYVALGKSKINGTEGPKGYKA
jgi:hypothetical protein